MAAAAAPALTIAGIAAALCFPRVREPSTAPKERSDISDQRAALDRAEPVDIAEPIDRIEPAEPTLPIDSTDPTLAMDRTEPRDPMLSNESCDHRDHLELLRVSAMPTSSQLLAATFTGCPRRPFCFGSATAGPDQAASRSPMSSAISGIRGFVRRLGSA